MITEDYCSFEVAKLLKEKGFDAECRAYWNSRIDDLPKEYEFICFTEDPIHQPYDNMHSIRKRYLAPTHQMAMKWLREKDIRICPDYSDVDGKWFTMIGTKKKRTYSGYYDIYEEAVEAALKYCLENLI